jgi:hypothetical protein
MAGTQPPSRLSPPIVINLFLDNQMESANSEIV